MHIDNTIAQAYLSGADLRTYQAAWFFSGSTIDADPDSNIFVLPPDDDAMRASVRQTAQRFCRAAEHFEPVNRPIWDALFPDWQNKQPAVDLIVGFPEPYDAVTAKSPDGQTHLIFDLICWSKYGGTQSLDETIRNILTHEFTHFLIGCTYPEADAALESADYLTKLDAYTFHEGFAHLISFRAAEIDQVDWHCAQLEAVYAACKEKMRAALAETDPAKQKQFLRDAVCGRFDEKFASMCGMLFLANQWAAHGMDGLKSAFSDYHGFAAKTLLSAV